jgi:hypothetical protein
MVVFFFPTFVVVRIEEGLCRKEFKQMRRRNGIAATEELRFFRRVGGRSSPDDL